MDSEILEMINDLLTLVHSAPNVEDGTAELVTIRLKRLWNFACTNYGMKSEISADIVDMIIFLEKNVVEKELVYGTVMEATYTHPGAGYRTGPSLDIPESLLCYFIEELFLTVTDISSIFKASVATIHRRMRLFGLSIRSTYSTMNDKDLDQIIAEIQDQFPNSGIRTISGILRSKNLRVQRERISAS